MKNQFTIIDKNGNEHNFDGEHILSNDVEFWFEMPLSKAFLIGNEFGSLCVVWARDESDALDEMVDNDLGGSFLVEPEDIEPELEKDGFYCYLGNAGEPADLSYAWVEEIDLKKQPIEMLLAFAEARGGCYKNLDMLN